MARGDGRRADAVGARAGRALTASEATRSAGHAIFEASKQKFRPVLKLQTENMKNRLRRRGLRAFARS